MSVHNGRRYIERAVRSLDRQTFNTFDVVIIDDGSTDGTRCVLEQLARTRPNLRVYSREPRGLTQSLNEGIALCDGAYIARMDADDVAHKRRFEAQVEFLESHPDYGCVGTGVTLIDSAGRRLFDRVLPVDHDAICEAHLMGYGGMIVHPTAMIRRDVMQAVNGYDNTFRYAQDYDLWCRIAASGFKLYNIPRSLLFYRIHHGGISHKYKDEQKACIDRVVKRELSRAGRLEPVPMKPEYRMNLQNAAWIAKHAARDGYRRAAIYYSLKNLKWVVQGRHHDGKDIQRSIHALKLCLQVMQPWMPS